MGIDIKKAASALGKIGGKVGGKSRSEAKAAASRRNGLKGGRKPRGYLVVKVPLHLDTMEAKAAAVAAEELGLEFALGARRLRVVADEARLDGFFDKFGVLSGSPNRAFMLGRLAERALAAAKVDGGLVGIAVGVEG